MLIKCPDCSKEVSDQAVQCIGCGAPLVEPRWWKRWPAKTFVAGVGLLCIGMAFYSDVPQIGAPLIVIGAIVGVIGRFVIWLGTE